MELTPEERRLLIEVVKEFLYGDFEPTWSEEAIERVKALLKKLREGWGIR